jgi:flagellar basal-body rod protein FlgC
MSFFNSINIAGTALTAQQLRLDVLSQNMANADTTRTAEGGPYRRKAVLFQERTNTPFMTALNASRNRSASSNANFSFGGGVRVSEIAIDETPGPMVYDPSHPDANADGYVEKPNVNVVMEMVSLISASRSYEANVTAMGLTKAMMAKTFEISRG